MFLADYFVKGRGAPQNFAGILRELSPSARATGSAIDSHSKEKMNILYVGQPYSTRKRYILVFIRVSSIACLKKLRFAREPATQDGFENAIPAVVTVYIVTLPSCIDSWVFAARRTHRHNLALFTARLQIVKCTFSC
jgi:hypothetical protein